MRIAEDFLIDSLRPRPVQMRLFWGEQGRELRRLVVAPGYPFSTNWQWGIVTERRRSTA